MNVRTLLPLCHPQPSQSWPSTFLAWVGDHRFPLVRTPVCFRSPLFSFFPRSMSSPWPPFRLRIRSTHRTAPRVPQDSLRCSNLCGFSKCQKQAQASLGPGAGLFLCPEPPYPQRGPRSGNIGIPRGLGGNAESQAPPDTRQDCQASPSPLHTAHFIASLQVLPLSPFRKAFSDDPI